MILPLERKVSSIEPSKRLKELGVKQESLFYWWSFIDVLGRKHEARIYYCDDDFSAAKESKCYSAFTVAELGEMLKKAKKEDLLKALEHVWGRKVALYEIYLGSVDIDKAAKMLIYLLENELITLSSDPS